MVVSIEHTALVSIESKEKVRRVRAIVTLAIGDRYRQIFERHCRENWTAYAQRHGYDLILITEPIDQSEKATERSLHWQKCLILEDERVARYQQVAWIDSDIVINASAAPDIFGSIDVTRFGAVDEYCSPDPATYRRALAALYLRFKRTGVPFIHNLTPEEFYRKRGLPERSQVVQTGVFVCSPRYHRDVLRVVYDNYEENALAASNAEMAALSYELLSRDLVTWIDARFNHQVLIGAEQYRRAHPVRPELPRDHVEVGAIRSVLDHLLAESYFLHFAGCQPLMEHLRQPPLR